jgi:Spy/CpxP family protein refolding chaperone
MFYNRPDLNRVKNCQIGDYFLDKTLLRLTDSLPLSTDNRVSITERDFRTRMGTRDGGGNQMKASRWKILAAVMTVALLATVAFSQSVVKTTQGMGHQGGFGARMLGFYADYLDLTDAQQAQMKDILAKEKPTIQPLMQQLAQGRQQMSQLEQAGTFDEAKVRAVATQQSQTVTELMVQKVRIKSELMALLTPDQKDKMAKLEARREARMQKHLEQGQAPPSQ